MRTAASKSLTRLSLIICGAITLFFCGYLAAKTNNEPNARFETESSASSSLLRAIHKGEIVVGYGGHPPYTVEDPNTGKLSGLSVDLANEIGNALGVKLIWKRFNWNTMTADMKRGEIDLIVDPVFETIPRSLELSFSRPYAFVPSCIGLIRKGGPHFPSLEALDRPQVKIAVGQGFAEETLIRRRAPNAEILAVPANDDTAAAANFVLSGRADIALVTLSDALRFAKEHPDKLEVLWKEAPPAYMPASLALPLGDLLGTSIMNSSIDYLRYTKIISGLAKKYNIEEDFDPKIGND